MVGGIVALLSSPPPPKTSTPPKIDTAPAGFFFCGLAGSLEISGLVCGSSFSTFPLSTGAANRSSAGAVC